MEPLAVENKKLKEARNLLEKNIQRAQHERDLAESNAQDLEYQKGVLTEKLAAMSEQVWSQSDQLAAISDQLRSAFEQLERKSEQLNSISKQKAEQDTGLGQMRQAIDQLCQEKAKEAERADKLAEELKGEFLLEAKVQKENYDAVIATIKTSIGGGFAEGLDDAGTQQQEDEVEEAAKMLASDIDLFGEMDGNGKAQ
ncbi:uncharacterized protein [Miscanthus floridulus]|uniref:uncharacterized protein n=1 Tax=Miscanthus floridulus TaxID=154761 RepID=UPI00345821EC